MRFALIAYVQVLLCGLCGAQTQPRPQELPVGQVEVKVPKLSLQAGGSVDVQVSNSAQTPVSFCVQVGLVAYSDDGARSSELAPTPFYAQGQGKGASKWHTLKYAKGVAYSPYGDTLNSGQTRTYPMKILDRGEMRLVLRYVLGDEEFPCERLDDKVAYSRSFHVE
jgi:hypothetical protein